MALTAAQKKARTKAELEMRIAQAWQARRDGDDAGMQAAKDWLADFNTPFPDLNELAHQTAAAIGVAEMRVAMDQYSEIASDLMPLAGAFKEARDAADARERDLLLPHLAAFAAQSAQVVTSLKEGIDGLREELQSAGNADDLGELASSADNVVERLNDIRRTVERLMA